MVIPEERSRTDGVLSHQRNWSELPEDILHLISKKLPDVSDFIRFRAVCKRWQLSAPITDPPPQLPWFLEHRRDVESGIIRFYCLSSSKVHTITCPGSRNAFLEGPACHYLFASHMRNSEMYLLNPLTHDQIHVPFVNFLEYHNYIGPDPIEGGDILVISGPVEWTSRPKLMAFWRPKANDWVYVEGVGDGGSAYYMGQYFSNDEATDITNVIDIATKKMVYQVAPPEGTNPLLKGCYLNSCTFLVESGGKILRLFQYYEAEMCQFDIYYLHFGDGEGKPYWVNIIDIGDHMLFLQYYRGLSFCASNFAGFKGNCIYFCKYGLYMCRYDIGDGTIEVLPCPIDLGGGTWFVPSLV